MSINTITIPLNQEGALELGKCPCGICDVGWSEYCQGKKSKHCMDTCEYYKKWVEKT